MYRILGIDPGIKNLATCLISWTPGLPPVVKSWENRSISEHHYTSYDFLVDLSNLARDLVTQGATHIAIEQQPNMAKTVRYVASGLAAAIVAHGGARVYWISPGKKLPGFKGTYAARKAESVRRVSHILDMHQVTGDKLDDYADAYLIALCQCQGIIKKMPVNELRAYSNAAGKRRASLEQSLLYNLGLGP